MSSQETEKTKENHNYFLQIPIISSRWKNHTYALSQPMASPEQASQASEISTSKKIKKIIFRKKLLKAKMGDYRLYKVLTTRG